MTIISTRFTKEVNSICEKLGNEIKKKVVANFRWGGCTTSYDLYIEKTICYLPYHTKIGELYFCRDYRNPLYKVEMLQKYMFIFDKLYPDINIYVLGEG